MFGCLLVPSAAQADYYGGETDYGVVLPSGNTPADWGDEYYSDDGTRAGSCVNKHTAGTWAHCNKDFPEGRFLSYRAARYNSGNRVDGGELVGHKT